MFKKTKHLVVSLVVLSIVSLNSNMSFESNSIETHSVISRAVETKSADEFISDLTTYDWASENNTFDLEYDVDFTDFNASTEDSLTLEADPLSRYTFNGNGHKFTNKKASIPPITSGSYSGYYSLTNASIASEYLFSTVTNVDFYDIHFDNYLFFIENSTNNTFTNIAFENTMLNKFFFNKRGTTREENVVGIWNNTMTDDSINNLVIKDVSFSDGIIDISNTIDSSSQNSIFLAPIGEVKNSLTIDGLFLDNITFDTISLSNNNYDYSGLIILSNLYAKGETLTSLEVSNAYIGETAFKRITAFDRLQNKNYSLIGGLSNSLTSVLFDDIVIDSNITSDITITDSNQRYVSILETSYAYDASDIFISNNDQISFYSVDNPDSFDITETAQFVSRDTIYEIEFISSLLGDTTFIYLENNQNPRAIIDMVEVQLISETQTTKFAKVEEAINYQAKTLFASRIDNGDYDVAIADSKSKILFEQILEFDGEISGSFNKIKDKSIVVWDNNNNEIIFGQLIWESNALYVLWLILIIATIIVLIILLIIMLLALKRSKDDKYLNAYKEELSTEIQLLGDEQEEHYDDRQVVVFNPAIANQYDDDYGYGDDYSNDNYGNDYDDNYDYNNDNYGNDYNDDYYEDQNNDQNNDYYEDQSYDDYYESDVDSIDDYNENYDENNW